MADLVTGGLGFIGSYLAEKLAGMGREVIVLDNASSSVVAPHEIGVEAVIGDICSGEDLARLPWSRIDTVYHLAAIADPAYAHEKPLDTIRINAYCTAKLLEHARAAGARVIYASSASVYGVPRYTPIDEEHPLSPISVYGASKLSGELFVQTYSREHGLEAVTLRLFNVYGGRSNKGVIYIFMKSLLEGRRPVIYGDGGQVRDFVHVYDVVDALVAAAGYRGEHVSVNIGTGRPVTIREVYDMIRGLLGVDIEPLYAAPRGYDIPVSVADITRAKSLLGWSPRIGLEEGLRITLEELRLRLGANRR